jgi:hypothetical protein
MFNNSININKTNNHTNQKSLNIKKDHNIWLSICIFYYRHLHTLYCLYVYSITDIYTHCIIYMYILLQTSTLYCLYVYSIIDIYTVLSICIFYYRHLHCIVYMYILLQTSTHTVLSICIFYYRHLHTLYCLFLCRHSFLW